MIATGSHSLRPPVDGIDGPLCVDSTSLLEITEVPRRLLVLGGGVIGVEFASIMQHWGVEVTIVEMLDRLIPAEDADASKELARAFKKRGITMHLDSRATAVVEGKNGVTVTFQDADAKGGEVKADLVLVATGRGPSVHNIGLESAGVSFDPRTGVDVDAHMRTTVPHIYAVGDVAGKFQLAHTSFREGEIAAENALGHDADDRLRGGAALHLHRSRGRGGGSHRGPGPRAPRRRCRGGKFPFSASARAQMTARRPAG